MGVWLDRFDYGIGCGELFRVKNLNRNVMILDASALGESYVGFTCEAPSPLPLLKQLLTIV
jgi:hypothetical protein